ncbi:solute carrier family 22 member 7-like [Anopheles bellator]|uniref:solute carrier family 22 member 7-like n=1 Tax=Anopheles bellator TaxID=139047 RepID=UPI0026491600|nr:solute carrier family 22 member 7-like [Anopheles bellator]
MSSQPADDSAGSDAAFDRIMESIGNDGPFQRRYNIIFNVVAVLFFAMIVVNVLLILAVPEHRCSVPPLAATHRNLSTDDEQWKDMVYPKEYNSRGEFVHSACLMFNVSWDDLSADNVSAAPRSTMSCIYGFEYDRSYYDRTPVTEQNWVCENELQGTNVFAFVRVSEVCGTFILGQLGDRIGRLPVYLFGILTAVVGRVFAAWSASHYWLFALLAFIGSFSTNTSFQSPLIILMEISKDANRASLSLWQLIGWTGGICIAPLVLWAMRDWFWFMIVTSAPCVLFYCFPQYSIESPRWLASQGRYRECLAQLRKIATINHRPLNLTEAELKVMIPKREIDKTYGIASLFGGWHMTKLTTLLLLSWICNTIPTLTLFLMSLQRGGNPFLNNFWQGAVELPAYLVGQISCDRIGRRFTNSGAFLGATLACVPIALLIHHPGTETYVTMLSIVLKFFVCITYFALYLQSVEMYPTPLRQTGTSFGIIISNVFGALGPYIVFLGTNYDIRLPFVVMGLIGLVGAASSVFLPETLHQKLPETLDEGRRFGQKQRFWTIPKQPAGDQQHPSASSQQQELQKLNKPPTTDS